MEQLITKKVVADKIEEYFNGKLELKQLVLWAERAMMDSDFEDSNFDIINNIVSRIGLADSENFSLTKGEINLFLEQLSLETSKTSG